MKKATFANGVVLYYDEEKHALPTHFGDADGVQHELVTLEAAGDDEEVRYEEPATPAPAPSADFVPTG